MHVELPLLIVNHNVQTVNLCCIIIMASRRSGRSKGYSGAFLVPPTTGQKLPEMPANLQALIYNKIMYDVTCNAY